MVGGGVRARAPEPSKLPTEPYPAGDGVAALLRSPGDASGVEEAAAGIALTPRPRAPLRSAPDDTAKLRCRPIRATETLLLAAVEREQPLGVGEEQ